MTKTFRTALLLGVAMALSAPLAHAQSKGGPKDPDVAIAEAVAKCKKGGRGGIGSFLKTTVRSFSISGKDGPAIGCMSKEDSTPQAEASAAKMFAMEEYRGALREELITAPELEAYFRGLLTQVAAAWPADAPPPARKATDLTVRVGASPGFAAKAWPDGVIVVDTGLLEQASNEDEVLFVIAHEYAHMAADHMKKDAARLERRKFFYTLADAADMVATLQSVRTNKSGNNVTFSVDQGALTTELHKVNAGHDTLRYVTDRLFEPAWSRAFEDEADTLAVDLLAQIRPSAVERGFASFDKFQKSRSLMERMQEQAVSAVQANLQTALAGPEAQAYFQQGAMGAYANRAGDILKGELAKSARGALADFLGDTHLSPDKRKEGLKDYVNNAYGGFTILASADGGLGSGLGGGLDGLGDVVSTAQPGSPEFTAACTKNKPADAFGKARCSKELGDAVIATRAIIDAQQKAQAADFAGAKLTVMTAMKTRYADHAFVLQEVALAHARTNEKALAKSYFTKAIAGKNVSAATFDTYIEYALGERDFNTATTVIAAGKKTLTDDDRFLAQEIRIARETGKADVVLALAAKCQGTARDQLIKDCQAAQFPGGSPQAAQAGGIAGAASSLLGGGASTPSPANPAGAVGAIMGGFLRKN